MGVMLRVLFLIGSIINVMCVPWVADVGSFGFLNAVTNTVAIH
jgi:hypothetical protein